MWSVNLKPAKIFKFPTENGPEQQNLADKSIKVLQLNDPFVEIMQQKTEIAKNALATLVPPDLEEEEERFPDDHHN